LAFRTSLKTLKEVYFTKAKKSNRSLTVQMKKAQVKQALKLKRRKKDKANNNLLCVHRTVGTM